MRTLRLELHGEQSLRRQGIVLHGDGGSQRAIAYEHDLELAPPQVCDGYVCAVIFDAMRRADRLIVAGALSQRFLRNIRAFQEAWHCLRPDLYKVVDVEPTATTTVATAPVQREDSTICGFSGGIDSSFSVLRRSYSVTAAAMVHGFDIPCQNFSAFEALRARVVGITDAAGIELKTVRTTIREGETENWEHYHAAALASVLHLFSSRFSHGMIAGSDSYNYISYLPYAWGSSPATDYLLSGAGMEIVHDGAGYTRPQKVAWLSRGWSQLVPLTQFCWEGKSRHANCGACNKCVQTRLSLLAAGVDDRVCFSSEFDLSMLDSLAWDAKNVADLKVIVDLAEQTGHGAEWLPIVRERAAGLVSAFYAAPNPGNEIRSKEAMFFKSSGIHGMGMHSRNPVSKGKTITFLTGEQVSLAEVLRRIEIGKLTQDDPLQVDKELYIDLDHDCFAINHSCDPNAGIRGATELVAIKDIAPNDEITFDYSTTVSVDVPASAWTMKCGCGSAKCRHTLGNVLSIPPEQLVAYFELGVLPRYILAELCEQIGSLPKWLGSARDHAAGADRTAQATIVEERRHQERLALLQQELDAAVHHLVAIQSSTSWKMTFPIRRVLNRVRASRMVRRLSVHS
jgi:hypothetical protein